MELCCVDSSDPTLGNSLFGAVKLLKTANTDNYKYYGYGLDLIWKELFHFLLVALEKI